jgi:hypothetical protein
MSGRLWACALVASAVLSFHAPVAAQTLPERLSEIETLIERGDTGAVSQAARELYHTISRQAGFSLSDPIQTVGQAMGFGLYERRAGNLYRSGETIYVYLEPFGFSVTPGPDGLNRLVFDVDFLVLAADGRDLSGVISMGEIVLSSFAVPLDAYLFLSYDLEASPGPYILRTRVTDRRSGELAQFDFPVEIEAPGAPRK